VRSIRRESARFGKPASAHRTGGLSQDLINSSPPKIITGRAMGNKPRIPLPNPFMPPMKSCHLIAGFAFSVIISQSLDAQKDTDSSPEQIAARLAEWTQSGAMDKLVEVYHPDDLAAYQATLLEMTERLKAYGEPAPFAQAGMTPEQAKAMPAKEFMNRILHAASAGINENLKEFKITVTAKVTEKTESAAQVTVRTQAQLTEAQNRTSLCRR
jgi:hypothetical protein